MRCRVCVAQMCKCIPRGGCVDRLVDLVVLQMGLVLHCNPRLVVEKCFQGQVIPHLF